MKMMRERNTNRRKNGEILEEKRGTERVREIEIETDTEISEDVDGKKV
jgi:hypothetical protein